jgi:type I restriction enzyme M protein
MRLRHEIDEGVLPALEGAPGWTKLSEPERLALVSKLESLVGLSSTDRAEVERKLGPLPKAIEKAVWDATSVRDPDAPIITGAKGRPEPDPDLRDNENVRLSGPTARFDEDPTERLASAPYRAAVDEYMAAEVLAYVPDAWVDHSKTKVGYEIPLTRHFYRYAPPRPLAEIDAEIRALEAEIQKLLGEVTL